MRHRIYQLQFLTPEANSDRQCLSTGALHFEDGPFWAAYLHDKGEFAAMCEDAFVQSGAP